MVLKYCRPKCNNKKPTVFSWLGALFIFVFGLLLLLLAHWQQGFATWYAAHIFPIFPHTLGWFFGLFPFSVIEIAVIAIVLYVLVSFVLLIINLSNKTRRQKLKARLPVTFCRLAYILAIILLVFVLTTGINYNRESYADHLGITVQPSSAADLVQLYHILVMQAETVAAQVTTDDQGRFILPYGSRNIHASAQQSMYDLHNLHGGLVNYFPQPKGLTFSRQFSYLNIGGFFSPWTIEANYNRDIPHQSIPFVITHELAHLAGHMREDEANFIAYLAARNADCINLQYSAAYIALIHTLNALHRAVGREQYIELFALIPPQVQRDFVAARAYWQEFEGPVAELATLSNDVYLRLNQQHDGVQSYGRIVDLLLAYYRNTELWHKFGVD